MAEAIAEAETARNINEMEGDVMTTERNVLTPGVDRLQVPQDQRGEGLSMDAEGTGSRTTISDEIRRGKQPMTPSQQERDARPREQQFVDKLRLGGNTPRRPAGLNPTGPETTRNTSTTMGRPTKNVGTGQTPEQPARRNSESTPAGPAPMETANTPWGLWSMAQYGKAERKVSQTSLTAA